MSERLQDRVGRLVSITRYPDRIELELTMDVDLPLGLRVHHGERDGFIRRTAARAGAEILVRGRCFRFSGGRLKDVKALKEQLVRGLSDLARRPISQKTVEHLLDISSRERLEWSKQGLLPVSGTAFISRGGNKVALPTYAPGGIEDLLEQPELIASWRHGAPSE